jgi:hypothetical protein
MTNGAQGSGEDRKELVNPIAVKDCFVLLGEHAAPVLDVSFVRLVLERGNAGWESAPEGEVLPLEFQLDRARFKASARLRAKGEGFIRLTFESMLPSARAHLRSFLSPKKVGESLVEDWSTDTIRHFHGLNESELWFEPEGGVLFTYLDPHDTEAQFIVRMAHSKSALIAGKILRREYIELKSLDHELPLIPLNDKEIYSKLGECRDIVTNFRPTGSIEYNLKQQLLRVISDYLYSTSRKVEMTQMTAARTLSLGSNP